MHSMRAKHVVARSVTLKEAKGKTRVFTKGSVNQIELPSFFFRLGAPEARPTGRGKRRWVGWLFTQGVGLGGLALGYYQAAPPGLRKANLVVGASGSGFITPRGEGLLGVRKSTLHIGVHARAGIQCIGAFLFKGLQNAISGPGGGVGGRRRAGSPGNVW